MEKKESQNYPLITESTILSENELKETLGGACREHCKRGCIESCKQGNKDKVK